jgi:hypothetical protein
MLKAEVHAGKITATFLYLLRNNRARMRTVRVSVLTADKLKVGQRVLSENPKLSGCTFVVVATGTTDENKHVWVVLEELS